MRPARKGPENDELPDRRHRQALPSMRPARKGPENGVQGAGDAGARPPSMRPARKGPENATSCHASSARPRSLQ